MMLLNNLGRTIGNKLIVYSSFIAVTSYILLLVIFSSTSCLGNPKPMFMAPDDRPLVERQQAQQQKTISMEVPTITINNKNNNNNLNNDDDDDDSYILLTDDELSDNAEMLRYLTMATKEEVEEIIEGNPAIQEALLKKIKKILRLKLGVSRLLAGGNRQNLNANNNNHQQQLNHNADGENDDDNEDDDNDEDNIDDEHLERMDAAKVEMLKMKLKSKATKLFKIGETLKRKIKALRRKKARLDRGRPKFHFNVTTSSS